MLNSHKSNLLDPLFLLPGFIYFDPEGSNRHYTAEISLLKKLSSVINVIQHHGPSSVLQSFTPLWITIRNHLLSQRLLFWCGIEIEIWYLIFYSNIYIPTFCYLYMRYLSISFTFCKIYFFCCIVGNRTHDYIVVLSDYQDNLVNMMFVSSTYPKLFHWVTIHFCCVRWNRTIGLPLIMEPLSHWVITHLVARAGIEPT